MPRLNRASVQVSIVLRQQINVVKNKTVEVIDLQGLLITDIHERRPVERSFFLLLDDKYPVVQLLLPQERMHVLQEEEEMLAPAAERNDNGYLLQDLAEVRIPVAAWMKPGKAFFQLSNCWYW